MSGLSARELSAAAGLSPGCVALLEAGTRRFGQRSAFALARVLGVGAEWLVHGTGKPPSSRAVSRAVQRALASSRSSAAA